MPKRRNQNAPYWQQLRVAERQIIEYALEHGQTIRKTAEILGISPNFLSERTRELEIATPEVRPGPKPGTKPNRPMKPNLRVIPGESAIAPALQASTPPVRADTRDDSDDDLEDDALDEEDDLDEDEDEGEGEDDGADEDAQGLGNNGLENDDGDDQDEEDARDSGN